MLTFLWNVEASFAPFGDSLQWKQSLESKLDSPKTTK